MARCPVLVLACDAVRSADVEVEVTGGRDEFIITIKRGGEVAEVDGVTSRHF